MYCTSSFHFIGSAFPQF